MTLDRNPTNFFAETEQVAFHTGHVVRASISPTTRCSTPGLFSYLDTQLTRLGGPNFDAAPDQPAACAGQQQPARRLRAAGHPPGPRRVLPQLRRAADVPFATGDAGYVHVPADRSTGAKDPAAAPSRSTTTSARPRCSGTAMTAAERDHIVGAFSFELGKVADPGRSRPAWSPTSRTSMRSWPAGWRPSLGVDAPAGDPPPTSASSPALSLVTEGSGPIDGRVVGVHRHRRRRRHRRQRPAQRPSQRAGAALHVIAPHGGSVAGADERRSPPTPPAFNTDAVVYDALDRGGRRRRSSTRSRS